MIPESAAEMPSNNATNFGTVVGLILLIVVIFVVWSLNAGPRAIEILEKAIHDLLMNGYDGGVPFCPLLLYP